MTSAPAGARAKALGAFYTAPAVADFLAWWALRTGEEMVIDPSFGGGALLEAAARRIRDLGGNAETQVHGVELDAQVHARVCVELRRTAGLDPVNLRLADFFDIAPAGAGPLGVKPFGAVVGNPPFIRYQRFGGHDREKALRRAAEQGVRLSGLASSWAAFVVHAAALLEGGGRLAMVVPMELGHAAYARPVLAFLQRSFRALTLLTFQRRLFPDLGQDTLLLLAEGRGEPFRQASWRDLSDAADLAAVRREGPAPLRCTRRVDLPALAAGRNKLAWHFLPRRAVELYRELTASPSVKRLGDLADVGIGYVTGANGFFHLSPDEARERALPEGLLKRAVFRGGALNRLGFGLEAWQDAAARGDAGYLFAAEAAEDGLGEAARAYLRAGEAAGVHEAYKCRTRSPWYRVPHALVPDAFLTCMSGWRPRLVANEAEAVAPNTLHVVRLHPHASVQGSSAKTLGALWQTSLTCLSAELEGHALGGGMLKLEPSEARRVIVPFPHLERELSALADELDEMMRRNGESRARQWADEAILEGMVGLSKRDCRSLREAAETLRLRRYDRGGATRRTALAARP